MLDTSARNANAPRGVQDNPPREDVALGFLNKSFHPNEEVSVLVLGSRDVGLRSSRCATSARSTARLSWRRDTHFGWR